MVELGKDERGAQDRKEDANVNEANSRKRFRAISVQWALSVVGQRSETVWPRGSKQSKSLVRQSSLSNGPKAKQRHGNQFAFHRESERRV